MKYSILVLGASISISLFIRLCCSLEANLEKNLLSGRADEVYEKFLRFSLQNGVTKDKSYNEKESHLFDEWINDMKTFKNEVPLHKLPAAPERVSSKRGFGTQVDNEELCGNSKPPVLRTVDCDDSEEDCSCDNITEIPPSGCQYDVEQKYLGCKKIDVIPRLPPTLFTLDLNETQIEKIWGNDIRNVSISNIRLYRNQIDYIHPWAFHDVENLNTLIIAGNKIEYLAYELYVGLDNTIFVDLQFNQISFEIYRTCPILPPDSIKLVLPQLLWLQFTGNPLTVIPSQMFAGLRESPVTSLYLDSCYLQEIDEDALSHLSRLTTLNLSKNPSSLVNPTEKFARILKPLTSLSRLYLADLGFSQFPMEAILQFSDQLLVLDLSGNKFHTIKYDELSKFPNLEELYLDESSIQVIENNAFADNNNLKSLFLRKNMIKQFPTYFPPSLKYLSMTNISPSFNSPSRTAVVNFYNLTSLIYLQLSGIEFGRISKETFKGLTSLRNIFLNDCNVHSIEDGAFQELSNLDVLHLDNNVISGIHSETFFGLDNLRTLHMNNCTLSFDPILSTSTLSTSKSSSAEPQFIESPFKFLPKLTTLKLTGNEITVTTPFLFGNLSKLCYIDFTSNPIESWKARLFSTIETHSCDESESNDSQEIKDWCRLDLPNGKIQFINDAMLEDFRKFQGNIDLSNNELVCDIGACMLRDLIFNPPEKCTYVDEWVNKENYKCKDVQTGNLYHLSQVTDSICSNSQTNYATETSLPSESGATTTIIVVIASVSLVMSVIILLAYKNRTHLRYFWFSFKFNIMPASPRKAKISTMEENLTSSSYDYDVFISYHNDDSTFIEEVFLPEIEVHDDNRADETEVVEAKNLVYFIENDAIVKKSTTNNNIIINSNGSSKAASSTPRFKVCLHERDFAAGVPITDNIVNCVDRSRKTVIFVSRKYMESQWCSYELNLAYHRLVESRRRSFLLVLMEEVPTEFRTKVLTFLMVSKTYLQWPGVDGLEEEKKTFWKRLRHFLQSS